MPILRQRVTWRREPIIRSHRVDRLTTEQIKNVRLALRVLRRQHGSWPKLARAMRVQPKNLERILYGPRRPTVGHALRAANVAGVSIDAVLSGAFLKPHVCPTCGRCN